MGVYIGDPLTIPLGILHGAHMDHPRHYIILMEAGVGDPSPPDHTMGVLCWWSPDHLMGVAPSTLIIFYIMGVAV
ncbi:unnamed protein product [Linum trigynum]|uniref:Uncharacterized protein n=1 Tax=Linum trigynum TaxID=586398 RepID=A0AAV2FQD0_9ROSI